MSPALTQNVIINGTPVTPPSTPRRSGNGGGNSGAGGGSQDSQGSNKPPSDRKRPRCRYCGRLKKGHPASGCPYVDPPIPPSPPRSEGNKSPRSNGRAKQTVNENTVNQLGVTIGQLVIGSSHTVTGTSGGPGGSGSAPFAYPNARLRRTRTQEEQDFLFSDMIRTHHSAGLFVLPLSADDLQAQRRAAQRMHYHVRTLQAQASWQDPRDILVFGMDRKVVDAHCERVERRAARGTSLQEILAGVGMARGLLKEMLAVWSLFCELRG